MFCGLAGAPPDATTVAPTQPIVTSNAILCRIRFTNPPSMDRGVLNSTVSCSYSFAPNLRSRSTVLVRPLLLTHAS